MNKWFAALLAFCLLALSVAAAEEIQLNGASEVDTCVDGIELDVEDDIGDIVSDTAVELDLGEDCLLPDNRIITEQPDAKIDAVPNASGVAIDEANFPDEVFREYVGNYDTDGDGVLSESESASVTDINWFERDISSLRGIEYFSNLRVLRIGANKLTSLDLSKCTALEELDCESNQLVSLDVGECTALRQLECYGNRLESLDVSGCTALKQLNCKNNQLTTLNVNGCKALEELECGGNKLTNLDVQYCSALTVLDCGYAPFSTDYGNRLTNLDVSKCTGLKTLNCSDNMLTSLDVSKCTALEALSCNGNMLKNLDVSKCTALKKLQCGSDYLDPGGNQLISLDVSHCLLLESLVCSNNRLTSLDVRKCTALGELVCFSNNLTSLNVSKCSLLKRLECYGNKLESLDINRCASLVTAVKKGYYTEEEGHSLYRADEEGDSWFASYVGLVACDTNVVITPKPAKTHIAACTVTVKDVVYTGKTLKPKITVNYGVTILKAGTDYTASYKNNKKIGTATVIVKGKGSYSGQKTSSFKINPKAVTNLKLQAGKGQLIASWKKISGVTGYQLQYGMDKGFSSSKKATVTGKTKKTLKNLKKGKTYYVRIRAYKKVNGKIYWSAWSSAKKAIVK